MFRKLNYTEPAVLRGIVTALIALASAVGFTVNTDLSGKADALIVLFTTVFPLIQALWTRFAVWSPKSVAEKVGTNA